MISIVIPVYNAEPFICDCISSILCQSYKDIEIICVDDGSTDNSLEMLNRYKKDSRIRIIHKENGGPNSARKAGVIEARGEFITFIDADDFIESEFCSCLYSEANTYNADIVVSPATIKEKYGNSRIVNNRLVGVFEGGIFAERIIDCENFYSVNTGTSLYPKLFRTEIIEPIMKDFDETITFSEDVICFMLACLDANCIFACDSSLYTQRRNSMSLTSNHNKRNYYSQKRLFKYMSRKLAQRDASNIMYRQTEQLIIRDLLIGGYEEAFGHLDELYPFRGIKIGSRLSVYGAGAFGIEIIKFCSKTRKYNINHWVDRNYQKYKCFAGISVESPQTLLKECNDIIVIAATNSNVSREISNELAEIGIEEDRIYTICDKLIGYNALPTDFWL